MNPSPYQPPNDVLEVIEATVTWIQDNYSQILSKECGRGSKIFIGSKNPRKCRYCGKDEQDTSFRKVAHAVPELLGNRNLIAYDECDRCNDYFAVNLEDHLGKYLLPLRVMSLTPGKKGHPSYKTEDGNFRIDIIDGEFKIESHDSDNSWEIDEELKTLTLHFTRQPFCPLAVFKSLFKIGLAVMPKDLLPNFQRVLGWLLMQDERNGPPESTKVFQTFIPGPRPIEGVQVNLYERKNQTSNVPYMMCLIAASNTIFQFSIPSPEKDAKISGKQVTIKKIPIKHDLYWPFGKPLTRIVDLSNADIISCDRGSITMSFEEATRVVYG